MVTAVQATGLHDAAQTTRAAFSDRALRTLLAAGRKLDTTNPAVVRQVAAQFMSELFLGPLLAEAREFPLGRELATGGRTETIFGAQLDQRVADKIASAAPGLIEQMAGRLSPHGQQAVAGTDQAGWRVAQQVRAGGAT
jgi:hypothetical protein